MSGSRVRPASSSELAQFLAAADKDSLVLVPAASAVPATATEERQVIACDLSGLTKVIEHSVADQVIQVETGIKVDALNAYLSKHNQMLPLRVPQSWTLLDAINAGESGTLEHGYGSLRELTLGLTAVMADGTTLHTGGRVVKNVTGYDLTKLLVGSRASLAIPVAAYLRVYALPETSVTLVWSFDSLWKLMNTALHLIRSGLPLAALEAVQNDKKSAVSKFVLFGQIYGLAAVKTEIAEAACRLVGQPQAQLEGQDEQTLWSDIAEFFLDAEPDKVLHLVAPPAELPNVLSKLPHRTRWQMRPLKGRITAVCPEVGEALQAAEELSRDSGIDLTVACADRSYNYRVRRLPADDSVQWHLKRRIKDELDPHSTLNPYVLL